MNPLRKPTPYALISILVWTALPLAAQTDLVLPTNAAPATDTNLATPGAVAQETTNAALADTNAVPESAAASSGTKATPPATALELSASPPRPAASLGAPGWTIMGDLLALASVGGLVAYFCGLTRARHCGHTCTLLLAGVIFGLLGFWVGGFAMQSGGLGDVHAALPAPANPLAVSGLNHELGLPMGGHFWGMMGSAGFFLSSDADSRKAIGALFLAQVPFGLFALALAARHLPRPPDAAPAAKARLDVAGTALLAPSLVAYALAMTVEHGPASIAGAGLLGLAAAGLLLFLRVEARVAAPLVPPDLLRDPTLRIGLFASTMVSAVMMATLIVGPFQLARGLGLDAARVGLALAAGPLATTLAALVAGRLADRFGAARTALLGLAVLVVGLALLAAGAPRRDLALYLLPIVVASIGYGLFQTANNAFVMTGAPADRRGLVSGLLNLSRNFGLVTGASVLGAIFVAAVGDADVAAAPPEAVARGFAVTFATAAMLILVAATGCLRLRHAGDAG